MAPEEAATPRPALGEDEEIQPRIEGMEWYIIQAYSGYERKVRLSLIERIKQAGMESDFAGILIPRESVTEIRDGKKRTRKKASYPGYIFVQMKLTDETWHLVKGTPKINGFIGGRKPSPVPAREIEVMTSQPAPKINFATGDQVRVTHGAFANYTGTIEEVQSEKAKLRVLISFFGRASPVELEYGEVEKIS